MPEGVRDIFSLLHATTPNGGPTFAGSDHLYPAGPGQLCVFKMPLTGSRKADVALANKMGGFAEKPEVMFGTTSTTSIRKVERPLSSS